MCLIGYIVVGGWHDIVIEGWLGCEEKHQLMLFVSTQ